MTTGHDEKTTGELSVDVPAISRADFLRLIGAAAVVGASASLVGVGARPKVKDSAEVYVGEDFVGTLSVDNEDGELCYQFQMAILELDLEDV